MKRGDIITIAVQGSFGKPCPALVIQSDFFEFHSSVTVLPLSSTLVDAPLLRITIQPDEINGLQKTSQIMLDKAITVRREKTGPVFGQVDGSIMIEVDRRLAMFLGIAK